MHNDSKLGLLAGVGGVIVAAVLLSQKPPVASNALEPTAQTAVAAPTNASTALAPVASTPVAARGRPEIEGKKASRASNDEDE